MANAESDSLDIHVVISGEERAALAEVMVKKNEKVMFDCKLTGFRSKDLTRARAHEIVQMFLK